MWDWTSVKDALPETNGRYLVASIAHSKPWHTIRPGWWNTDDEAIFEYYHVTHWMPLPNLPY